MDILTFFGRLHPLVVHLPIAFLPLAAIFHFAGNTERFAFLRKAIPWILVLTILSGITAVAFGLLLAQEGGFQPSALNTHKWLGIGACVLTVATLAAYWKGNTLLQGTLLLGSVGLIAATGHWGGGLTHGEDYLTQPLMGKTEEQVLALPSSPDSIFLYEHLIEPILAAKCYSCHNDTKQNGGLNMVSIEHLRTGGQGGTVLNSHARESELFARVVLPQSSTKFMPPKGDPLTFDEIQLLQWWLETGAKDSLLLAETEPNEEMKESLVKNYGVDLYEKPYVESVEVDPLPESTITALEEQGWKLNLLAQNNNLLEVRWGGGDLEASAINALTPAAGQVTWMDLSGLALEDEHLKALPAMPHLSRLNLSDNQLKGISLKILGQYSNLEALNLTNNPLEPAAIDGLNELKGLKRLYLWNTGLTMASLDELEPITEIVMD